MQAAVEREQVHRPVGPVIEDDADTLGINDVEIEGVLHGSAELFEGMPLQQPENADEGPGSVTLLGFEASPQEIEALGQ